MFNFKARGLTTREKFVEWWNENHPDFQITADSIKVWSYREDEDTSSYDLSLGRIWRLEHHSEQILEFDQSFFIL